MSFLTVEIILWCFVNREPSFDCFWLHSMSIESANAMIIGSNKRNKMAFFILRMACQNQNAMILLLLYSNVSERLSIDTDSMDPYIMLALGMCALCKSDLNASTLSVRSSILFIDLPTTQVFLITIYGGSIWNSKHLLNMTARLHSHLYAMNVGQAFHSNACHIT